KAALEALITTIVAKLSSDAGVLKAIDQLQSTPRDVSSADERRMQTDVRSDELSSMRRGRPAHDRFMRLPEVLRVCGFSRSTLYEKMGNGRFPRHVRLGENMVAWYESDVLGWLADPT